MFLCSYHLQFSLRERAEVCTSNIQTKAEFPWQPALVFSGHGDPEHLMEVYECDSFPFMVLRMQLYSQVKPIFSACFDGTIFSKSTKHCRKLSWRHTASHRASWFFRQVAFSDDLKQSLLYICEMK